MKSILGCCKLFLVTDSYLIYYLPKIDLSFIRVFNDPYSRSCHQDLQKQFTKPLLYGSKGK